MLFEVWLGETEALELLTTDCELELTLAEELPVDNMAESEDEAKAV